MKDIEVKTVLLKGARLICLYFEKDLSLVYRLKSLAGSCWHSALRCWVVPDTLENRKGLKAIFGDRNRYNLYRRRDPAKVTTKSGRAVMKLPHLEAADYGYLEKLRRWMEFRRYTASTIRIYTKMVEVFLRFIKPGSAEDALGSGIQRFTNEYIISQRLSYSYQNQLVNALKLFYSQVMKQELSLEQVKRPRPEYKLPNVLNKDEVRRMLRGIRNLKHLAMLTTIYGCGLRRSELLHLRPEDIDSLRGLLVVRQGKGKKDRVVPISMKNIELLREYYRKYRPVNWMFEGIIKGRPYDERSLQEVLKHAVLAAGIRKPVTLHWLRHSYATHLHESGVDIRYIQEILGHKNSRTTEIYTHVSSRSIQLIRSPLDDL